MRLSMRGSYFITGAVLSKKDDAESTARTGVNTMRPGTLGAEEEKEAVKVITK